MNPARTAARWWWRRMVRAASLANLRRAETNAKARLGREGEEAAYWFLREQGFMMVARNYRPDGLKGEIDLIGWDTEIAVGTSSLMSIGTNRATNSGILVFVEVKSRSSSELQTPEAAVDRAKQVHVLAAARQYRHKARQESTAVRFDIISVEYADENATNAPRIRHFRDAFR